MGGINYPKEFVKPDGRKLVSGGPRDLQRRQTNQQTGELDLDSLKKELHILREALLKTQQIPTGFFSPEQVDEEIRKAVEQAVTETIESLKNTDHQTELDKLKKEIDSLKNNLVMREELITVLKSKSPINNITEEVSDPNRPKMEQQFIDPLEKDAGKGLESHIDITDVTPSEKDNMSEKVDKLKNLLGKLPNKN